MPCNIYHKNFFPYSAKGEKIILLLTIQKRLESDEMSQTQEPGVNRFLTARIRFLRQEPLCLIIAARFKVPDHRMMSSLAPVKRTAQSQPSAPPHLLLIQSGIPQLFLMFLLICIMKGLIMLMRRPSGLVLSVGDTAVCLRAKSCAKYVT